MRRRRASRSVPRNFVPSIDVDAWLKENPMPMVTCPSQPGGLKLSEEACAKRYTTANEPRFANIGAEPFNLFVFKMNLKACASCKIGAKMARRHQQAA